MIRTLIFIGAGSFIGGIARYLLTRWIQNGTTSSFPFGTLVVNLVGCLLIGLLFGLFECTLAGFSHRRVLWRIHHLLHLCHGECSPDA